MLTILTERTRSRFFAWLLGMAEYRLDFTWADPMRRKINGWYTELDDAYDRGRALAHRIFNWE